MSDPNGVVAEKDLEEAVSQDALDNVDLSIPGDYQAEIMALELVVHLQNYHKAVAAAKAARQAENHQEAERLQKIVLLSKMNVALIQSKHPGAKAIADTIMRDQARQAAANRARAG